MAAVTITGVAEAVRLDPRHPRRRHRHRRRRVLRAGRPLRLRQVDAAADDRRARGDHQGRDRDRRPRREPRAAEGARHRDGVPELRAVSAHDGAREHVVRADAGEASEGGHRGARAEGGRHPRASRPTSTAIRASSRAASASASRWAARSCATRRCSCSTSRCRNLDAKLRVQMRTEIKELHQRLQDDVDLRHARPDRGDDDGRPHRRHARRHRRADRRPARRCTTIRSTRSSPASSARRR